MKRASLIFLLIFISCSPLELSRLFGVGLKPFREKGKIYAQTFDTDLPFCYAEIIQKLKAMEVSSYRGSQREGFLVIKNFVKIFPQCSASTEVAIFFTQLESFKTQVEIASLNYSLAEFIASELFNDLEKEKDIEN